MSNSIDGLSFSLFFARDFEGPEIASEIVRVFLSSNRSVRPVKYGVFGPDEDIVDAASVADTLMNIESPDGRSRSGSLILERNRGCGYQVQWNKSNQPGFSFIGGHLMFSSYGKHGGALDGFIDLVKDLVVQLSPVYGEIRSMAAKGWDTPINLLLRLPDVPPVSIYGKEYIEFFGHEKIEGAPFIKREKVGSCYWLVASEILEEDVPSAVRSSIRSFLGEKSFMADGKWKYSDGNAPNFDLSFSVCK